MDPDGTGYYVASLAVTKPGNYSANISIQTSTGTYSNGTTFSVYPEVGVRFRSDDPSQPDPVVGQDYAFSVDSYDPDTLAPKDPGQDLTLTLERWSDDHLTLYDSHAYPMQRLRTGVWKFEHTFAVKGMYHLRFGSVSGGFKPDDVPILHTYANDPTAGGSAPKKAPAPGVVVGIAALALAAWAMRRR